MGFFFFVVVCLGFLFVLKTTTEHQPPKNPNQKSPHQLSLAVVINELNVFLKTYAKEYSSIVYTYAEAC